MSGQGFRRRGGRPRKEAATTKEPTEEEKAAAEALLEPGLACVTWVPVRCPSCRSKPGNTYKTLGRVRYHECQDCGARFKSLEIDLPG